MRGSIRGSQLRRGGTCIETVTTYSHILDPGNISVPWSQVCCFLRRICEGNCHFRGFPHTLCEGSCQSHRYPHIHCLHQTNPKRLPLWGQRYLHLPICNYSLVYESTLYSLVFWCTPTDDLSIQFSMLYCMIFECLIASVQPASIYAQLFQSDLAQQAERMLAFSMTNTSKRCLPTSQKVQNKISK